MKSRGLLAAIVLGVAAVAVRSAQAGGGWTPASEPPQQNTSYVPSDDDGVKRAMATADKAADEKDWVGVARALQQVVDGSHEAVLLVSEEKVFEGAWIVAQHRLAHLGVAALAAYELEYGAAARSLLAAAAAIGDEAALARLADRWLPSAAGRNAALLLADLGLERGDVDAALGWLERLEDFEDALSPDAATAFAPERNARLARTAVALASGADALPRIRAWLADPSAAHPTREDLRPAPQAADWTTSGGDASRSLVPPTLKGRLEFSADHLLHFQASRPDEASRVDDGSDPELARPSPWLPPRAVVSGDRVYVSDGRFLEAFSFETGKLLAGLDAWPLVEGLDMKDVDGVMGDDARRRFGLIEGTGLTLAGDVAYCVVPFDREQGEPMAVPETPARDGDPRERVRPPGPGGPGGPRGKAVRLDHVAAVRVAGPDAGKVLWRAGGRDDDPGLPKGMRLHGTPVLYHGSLFVGGVRPSDAKGDDKDSYRWESYAVALDPATGAGRFATFLGSGVPIRRKNKFEVMPSPCAAAHGRVFLVTSLGLAAAVDAGSGRTSWTLRYDRGRPDGEDQARRLTDSDRENEPRRTTFANEPPILARGVSFFERPPYGGWLCFFTPTDSTWLYATSNRPRGAQRWLTKWKHERTGHFANLALEHLAGVTDGSDGVPPTLVGVGQGYLHKGEIHTSVVGMDPATGAVRWGRALPDGGPPSPYGRALVTRTQVFVSTQVGIAAYQVADGAELHFVDLADLPKAVRDDLLKPNERLWGNLIPVPGRGLVAVNEDYVAFWHAK